MNRFLLAAAALVVAALPARADTLPVVLDVPGTYTPGTPFTFELRAPGLADLGLYNIELVFMTDGDPTGLLGLSAAPPADPSLYPFGTTANFASGVNAGPGGERTAAHALPTSASRPGRRPWPA